MSLRHPVHPYIHTYIHFIEKRPVLWEEAWKSLRVTKAPVSSALIRRRAKQRHLPGMHQRLKRIQSQVFWCIQTSVWCIQNTLHSQHLWCIRKDGHQRRIECKLIWMHFSPWCILGRCFCFPLFLFCVCAYMYVCMYVCMCIYVRMYVCVYVHICMCVFMYFDAFLERGHKRHHQRHKCSRVSLPGGKDS